MEDFRRTPLTYALSLGRAHREVLSEADDPDQLELVNYQKLADRFLYWLEESESAFSIEKDES
jgi:hypothetical protein